MKMTIEIVSRRDQHVFDILPRRWVVERPFAWISKDRRTVRDYGPLPARREAMILWAMIALMTHRLAEAAELSDATKACRNTMSLVSIMRTDSADRRGD
jgi:hypothetical protein